MIDSRNFLNFLIKKKIKYFFGVPDSVLKYFTILLNKNEKIHHIITANEGAAVGMAVGNYLSTKRPACVYMQNSGLTNALNPILSIAHKNVYSVPILLIIGWRGAPNSNDEPQHLVMGNITKEILKLSNIKFCELNNKKDLIKLSQLINYSNKEKRVVACLIKENTLSETENNKIVEIKTDITYEIFMSNFMNSIKMNDRVISSTGFISRYLYNEKEKLKKNSKFFYMVGGMGHSLSTALGYNINAKKRIICLDGDGSFLMHLGSLVTAIENVKKNFIYILLNNYCHESVGCQPTSIKKIDIKKMLISMGFRNYFIIDDKNKLNKNLNKILISSKATFIEVKIKTLSKKNLPRPNNFSLIKERFIQE